MADHRQSYTPTTLYLAGNRMTDDYSVSDAVEDFLRMHPEANEAEVRAEVEQAAT
jgi:hypothetical protein